MMKSFFARGPMLSEMISPMERPLFLTDANMDPKSCTAPKNSPPMSTQRVTGIHPNTAAWMGPVMGPAPAMDEKWCPRSTEGFAGTKSTPSYSVCEGVSLDGSIPHFLASHLPYSM